MGNTRLSYTATATGMQIHDKNDYYPFGMNHLKTGDAYFGADSFNKYKFGSKELETTGMYDFGARFYMADVGRWSVVDPLAETTPSWSPYAYGFNNPIRFIDRTGMSNQDWVHNRQTNQIYWNENATSQATAGTNETYLGTSGTYTTESGSTTALNSDGSHTNNSLLVGLGIMNNLDPLIQAGDKGPMMSVAAFGISDDPTIPTISSPSDTYFSHTNTHLAMGVLQAGEITLTDLALAKVLGYGFKGYYALKQSNLTAESFSIHPRLSSQLDIGHRATTFVTDEVLQTGKVGVKDFNSLFFDKHSVFFNKNIGGKDFSVSVNPYNKTIFHQAPGVFK